MPEFMFIFRGGAPWRRPSVEGCGRNSTHALASGGRHRMRTHDCALGGADELAAHCRAVRRAARARARSDRGDESSDCRRGVTRARGCPQRTPRTRCRQAGCRVSILLGRGCGHRKARWSRRRCARTLRTRDRPLEKPGRTRVVRTKTRPAEQLIPPFLSFLRASSRAQIVPPVSPRVRFERVLFVL
jgi:hypothetical protein